MPSASASLPQGPLPDSGGARVLLLSRSGCHLCEQAQPVVERVAGAAGATVAVIDLDACASEVRDAWTDHVPVTVVDGRVVAIWFLDEATLSEALASSVAPTQLTERGLA